MVSAVILCNELRGIVLKQLGKEYRFTYCPTCLDFSKPTYQITAIQVIAQAEMCALKAKTENIVVVFAPLIRDLVCGIAITGHYHFKTYPLVLPVGLEYCIVGTTKGLSVRIVFAYDVREGNYKLRADGLLTKTR